MNCTPVCRRRRVLICAPGAGPMEPRRQSPRGFEHLCYRTVYACVRRRAEGIRRAPFATEYPQRPGSVHRAPPHPPQREPGLHEALIPGGTMVRPTGRPGRVWAGPVASTARALPRRIALQPPRCSPWRGVPCPSVPDRSARRQGVNRCAPFIACATLWALRSARRPLLLLRGASPAHPGAATALS